MHPSTALNWLCAERERTSNAVTLTSTAFTEAHPLTNPGYACYKRRFVVSRLCVTAAVSVVNDLGN
jgi:hypothetical protein